ncbi:hypothetical protein SEA_GREKAYCON_58 [Arthrobacter phage Grekaycon]|uniref:Uncharacterized protein n=2 Tax=Marthavirus martha TaxID=1980950 RepID=A0A514A5K4_9CAUD|nr:hypothetical protein SEA_GREKAYCON_58 [Arthrobacter phage Grekaycon]QED11797.1 hypothetical protein SEA_BOSSLADY_59 [Arthrobacter phage BossLady]
MKLTIKRELTRLNRNDEQAPLPLSDAVQMFYDGELIQLAQSINDEVLAEHKLSPMPYATIELEQTTKGKTLLVIRTDAIINVKDDEL